MSAERNDQQTGVEETGVEPARVVGNRDGLRAGTVEIAVWAPPSRSEAAARPPLPVPPSRPPLTPATHEAWTEDEAPVDRATPPPAHLPVPHPPRPEHIDADSVQGRAWEHPEDAAQIVRGMIAQGDERRVRDAGVLLAGLGEVGGEVLKHLGDVDLEAAAQAVTTARDVAPEEEERVLAAFEEQLRARQWARQGGVDAARRLLERAVGPRRAREILERVADTAPPRFHLLKRLSPGDVAPFIADEHPQTIALILSQLEPVQSADVLVHLPQALQVDVSYRIATMDHVTPGALKDLEGAIEHGLWNIIGGRQEVGGPKVLAQVLNHVSSDAEGAVLRAFDERDGEVAESVRNMMFTFDDLTTLSPPDLETLVAEVELEDLAVALKGTPEPLKDRIQIAVGEEKWRQLVERMEYLGPMPLGEVEQVQLRIVQRVRRLEAEGRVTIVRGADDNTLV